MEEVRGGNEEGVGSSKGGKGEADSGKIGLGHGLEAGRGQAVAGCATLKPHRP